MQCSVEFSNRHSIDYSVLSQDLPLTSEDWASPKFLSVERYGDILESKQKFKDAEDPRDVYAPINAEKKFIATFSLSKAYDLTMPGFYSAQSHMKIRYFPSGESSKVRKVNIASQPTWFSVVEEDDY